MPLSRHLISTHERRRPPDPRRVPRPEQRADAAARVRHLADQGRRRVRATSAALDAGYRHLDTAAGLRQRGRGRTARSPRAASRARTCSSPPSARPTARARALDTVRESLDRLQTDYVDLWLIHWPGEGSANADLWGEFVEAREAGLVRDIGVSNFDARAPRRGHQGDRSDTGGEPDRVEPAALRRGGRWPTTAPAASCSRATAPCAVAPSSTRRSSSIAERLGRTPAQVIIRWHLQHEIVVIPKSVDADRIRSNADVARLQPDRRRHGGPRRPRAAERTKSREAPTRSGCETAAMQLEQHLDGFREAVDAFAGVRDDGRARGRRTDHPGLGRTPPGRPPGPGPPLGDRAPARRAGRPGRGRAGGAGVRRPGRPGSATAPTGCSPRSRRRRTTSRPWSSSPTPRRRSGSGRGASATRPPSMPSTRCRRCSAATRARPTPGSTADVALDGIDELLTGFLPRPHSRLRADDPIDDRRAARGRRRSAGWSRSASSRRSRRAGSATRRPTWCCAAPRWRSTSPCGTAATRSATSGLDLWAEGARVTWA